MLNKSNAPLALPESHSNYVNVTRFHQNDSKITAAISLSSCSGRLLTLSAQTNVNVRIMAANLNGNTQSYQPFALRILQGLKPDVVCIQEFNYGNNAASDFQSFLNIAFDSGLCLLPRAL